ncbi:hypothetical protein CCACVL1_30668 [Corchorus capsularis]|uniref:Uncharacterized protein n=1 Tax=Corchorus capsularis TaxID=210143 RepID=A0A1R3FW42_COCAP|nr:hypothetical protein CCACVL1_30668 [Corchorus capsularis]
MAERVETRPISTLSSCGPPSKRYPTKTVHT